jgi:hypothetical protein
MVVQSIQSIQSIASRSGIVLFWGILALIGGQSASAQPTSKQLPPTARYARGQEVDLALIIEEWRRSYTPAQIPIFSCVCMTPTCDTKPRWPFRQYQQYQFLVALGPFNAAYNEEKGFRCFDLATGQQPNRSSAPTPPSQPTNLQARVTGEGKTLEITFLGERHLVEVTSLNINLLDSVNCGTLQPLPEQQLTVKRMVGEPAIDPATNRIAIGTLLDECVETQLSAVFIVEVQPNGAVAFYRVQVPGPQPWPNEFSSYPLQSITGLQFWKGNLLVEQSSAADSRALLVFRPDRTAVGKYAGCVVLNSGEGPSLCPP